MKILSTSYSLSFSRVFTLIFSLALFFALTVETNAQIGKRENNYNLKFVSDEKIAGATARPRIVSNTSETKTNAAAKVSAAAIVEFERRAFQLINEKRAAQNLPALKWNEDVARIARVHSQNMAQYKFLSHQGTDGSTVDDRADRIGLSKWRAIGENIAYNRGYAQPIEFAVERWMQSPKHKQNLLGDRWQESAIGVAIASDGSYYLTQVFLVRK
jgi:uncharacterized protein YkwD